MSMWVLSWQAIMCGDLFPMPPAVPIDILPGNHKAVVACTELCLDP